MKLAAVRKFALSLPGVSEAPHFDFGSFRVNKRIIVTVPPNDTLHVFVADMDRDECLMLYGDCTEKVLWGGKVVGIRVFLDKAKPAIVKDLILRAWKYRASKKELAALQLPVA